MTVTLPADLQGFVEDKVRAGAYSSEQELIRDAVTMLKNSDTEHGRQLQWLRNAIEEGWKDACAGNLTSAEDFEVEFAEFERQWVAEQSAVSAS